MSTWDPEDELRERLAVIDLACDHFLGVESVEHLLVDLLRFMKSGRLGHERQVAVLLGLMTSPPWRPGSVEVLEFTMRELQYSEIEERARAFARDEPDLSAPHLARQVLEVYGDEWPGGDIYRTYRNA